MDCPHATDGYVETAVPNRWYDASCPCGWTSTTTSRLEAQDALQDHDEQTEDA